MDHADFLKVVERLHGPLGQTTMGDQRRTGGFWNEVVMPRPSVLSHDSAAEDRAIFQFHLRGNGPYKAVDGGEVVVTLVDYDSSRKVNYPRHKSLPFHMTMDGTLCLGTTHMGGGWVIIDQANRPVRVMDGHHKGHRANAKPLGISRRADRDGGSFCLVTANESNFVERKLAARVLAMLEKVQEAGIQSKVSMPDMDFRVVSMDRKLTLRSDDESFAGCTQARYKLNTGVASVTGTGRWGIHGVPGMVCDMVGTVVSVDGFNVVVTDGEAERTFTLDPAEANRIASERSGFDLPHIEPIVHAGQKVMPGMSFFGPWQPKKVENPNDVPGLAAKLGGRPGLRLAQIRAWYVLTQAKPVDGGQLGYPIDFVVPASLQQVYLRVEEGPHVIAGPAENRRDKFNRTTPVRLCLQAGGVGFGVDLYNDSARRKMIADITRKKPRQDEPVKIQVQPAKPAEPQKIDNEPTKPEKPAKPSVKKVAKKAVKKTATKKAVKKTKKKAVKKTKKKK